MARSPAISFLPRGLRLCECSLPCMPSSSRLCSGCVCSLIRFQLHHPSLKHPARRGTAAWPAGRQRSPTSAFYFPRRRRGPSQPAPTPRLGARERAKNRLLNRRDRGCRSIDRSIALDPLQPSEHTQSLIRRACLLPLLLCSLGRSRHPVRPCRPHRRFSRLALRFLALKSTPCRTPTPRLIGKLELLGVPGAAPRYLSVLGGCGYTAAAHLQSLGARLQLVQHLLLADLRCGGSIPTALRRRWRTHRLIDRLRPPNASHALGPVALWRQYSERRQPPGGAAGRKVSE